jgi:uncharacterized membrane protein
MLKSRNKTAAGLKYTALTTAGGFAYGLLELLYRGHTHWTMVAAGGVCVDLLYLIAVKNREAVWKKWIMGGAVITTVEYITGLIVNRLLGWHVWSYAHSRLNLMGQISLGFSLIWLALSIPAIWMLRLVGRRIFRDGT